MMRKTIMILAAAVLLCGCSSAPAQEQAEAVIDKNVPITRGQAVKMLALSRYTPDEINALPRSVDLEDSDISNWCDKYINAAVNAGIISGTQENTFLQNDMLTLEQADFILKKAAEGKNLVLQYNKEDRKKPISMDVWLQEFDAIKGSAQEKEIVILADKKLCPQLSDNFVFSSEGLLCSDGLDIRPEYINKGIKAYIRDGSILALTEITTNTPTINNAVCESIADGGAVMNIKGCHIFCRCDTAALGLGEGQTYNIKISDNCITELVSP